MSNNCLKGCTSKYAIGPKKEKFLRAPDSFDAYSMAPFVKIKLMSNGRTITVGNKSMPSDNTAVIKSIEFGFIDSNEGKVEIIDEEGSKLTNFLDSVQTCTNAFNVGAQMEYQIGWVYTQCGSNTGGYAPSPWMRGIILKVSTNVSNGVIRFTIHFSTSHAITQGMRQDQIFGEEEGGKTMTIDDAIRQLAAKPPAINIKFGYYNESGELIYVEKHKWVNDTPKAAWHGDSQNKYSTIIKWLEGFRIDDGPKGKGAILTHDPSTPNDLLVLRDPQPADGESYNPNLSAGTFLVNGGKCSNVLEFSPSFDFVSAMAHFSSGGSTAGGMKSEPIKKEDEKPSAESCQTKDTGKQQTGTASQPAHRVHGPDNAGEETNKSQIAHDRASRLVSVSGSPIKAELRLVGVVDPEFYQIIQGKTCGIVVISPFYIQNTKAGSCGDFLKKADCHPFFSNSTWLILGINHAVQEGSFVTTLSVMLPVSSVQLDLGQPLGANQSGYVNQNQ